MIGFFKRKELFITFSMQKQAEIRQILTENNIEYIIKVYNRSAGVFSGTRSRTGAFGESENLSREYVIYVHKDDYEKARFLINR